MKNVLVVTSSPAGSASLSVTSFAVAVPVLVITIWYCTVRKSSEYVESVARHDLKLGKPGEVGVIAVPAPTPTVTSTPKDGQRNR